MIAEDVVKVANNSEINKGVSEKDVLDYFRKKNVGHWPSEKGEIEIETKDTTIILNIGKNTIGTTHQDLTAQGKMYLIQNFFEQVSSQAGKDISNWRQYKKEAKKIVESEKMMPQDFHDNMISRLSNNNTQFIKSGNQRIAFLERQRINTDGSRLLSYDLNILDNDRTSKYAIMAPSLKPTVNVLEEYKGQIRLSSYTVDGRMFENMEPWERAEYIAMTPLNIFSYQNVNRKFIEAGFMLTAITESNIDLNKKLFPDVSSLMKHMSPPS